MRVKINNLFDFLAPSRIFMNFQVSSFFKCKGSKGYWNNQIFTEKGYWNKRFYYNFAYWSNRFFVFNTQNCL